ncbi:hypothetical protein BDB01DRAFT_778999 [Pilobolus umbonatus]|nr:hypothetical protein BDB01DRAFT_778999 [Pilobolus umbonatus]
MTDHKALTEQFISMTTATNAEAQFFLEMNNWDLQLALSQFYDNSASKGSPEHTVPSVSEDIHSHSSPTTSSSGRTGGPKIRTLNDIIADNQNDVSDDEERENLYAGGEKSGMVVQGPNKRTSGGNSNNLVDEILKKAAKSTAVPDQVTQPKKPSYYSGSGYRLGSEDEPSALVQPTSPNTAAVEEEETVTRHMTFWRNGFSVDDGPLYAYSDPANQEMLTAINSGRAPLSLLNVRHGQPVEVRVVKRQDEDYTPPPKAPPKPFEGSGHRLGSPATYSGASSSLPATYPAESNAVAPTVDQSQPITSIQIRLGNGSRLIAKLNHTHTVGDIRQYIEASNPTNAPYILQTTFPIRELGDDSQTIKEAGLLNSVVVQRFQ